MSLLTGVVLDILASVLGFGIVVGIFVVIVVANRAEPDPSGRRANAVYCFAVSFLTLVVALFASLIVVASLVQLIGTTTGVPSVPSSVPPFTPVQLHPVGDAAARGAVLGSLILLAADAAFVFHRRRGLSLAFEGAGPGDPVVRVAQSYAAAIAFVMIFVLLVSLVVTVYALFRIAGPGVFNGGGGSIGPTRTFLDGLYLSAASGLILKRDLRLGNTLRGPRTLGPSQSEQPAA
jgi:hypothetical protein